MKLYKSLSEFSRLHHAVVTSGTFDGVHRGHQRILSRLQEVAATEGGESVVLTFWPHPRVVVSPESQDIKLLTTIDEKSELLASYGVQHLLVLPFTREFSELTSEDYVQQILLDGIGTKTLVIGYDHRFGRNREGGFSYLKANTERFGLSIEEIPRQEIDDLTISSTKIRNALQVGELSMANELLGRRYNFSGIVAKGRQLGRQLGYPTANVQVSESNKLIPADGVYAVCALVRGVWLGGVMNIGMRPTVEGIGRTQEVHIFDFEGDIYGERVTIELVSYIRPEQKFAGVEALKAQIEADALTARSILSALV